MTVGIVGLGLIGGSMARSIKERTGHTVLGADLNAETLTLARLCGAIDGQLAEEKLADCDLVLLAVRPGAAVDWVREHGAALAKHAVVVDLCGVKRAVTAQLEALAAQHGFTYVGGHPMAGRERSGFAAGRADLFVGASMILTPVGHTEVAVLERLKAFFLDLGFASLTFSTPEEHDRLIAYTSQLAHITSSAYIKSPTALQRRGFSAGSFRDMTRVARLDEEMWTELFLDNTDNLTRELDALIDHLTAYREALAAADAPRLTALLREGRLQKEAAGGN